MEAILLSYKELNPEEYQRALEQGVVLSAYARVMFVGPGGVGKSSLLHGLMNKKLPSAESTQLAETKTIKPVTTKWASAGGDSKSFWQEVTDNDEIMELVGLVLLVAKASAGRTTSSRFIHMLENALSSNNQKSEDLRSIQTSTEHIVSIHKQVVNNILTQVVKIAKENPDAQAPEIEILIITWDCGGQSVFLDVLPAFLTPRTMFLLMFDARRSLTDHCIIRCFQGGKMIKEQMHKATTLELLLEWMASIHAMLGSTTKAEESIPKFPRIIPVGTHGDNPNVIAKKEEITQQLTSECTGKAFVHLLKDCVVVDNTTAGKEENEDPAFSYIREQSHEFANKDLSIRTPVTWVLFRRVFKIATKESKSSIVPYQVVKDIATECNIPSKAIPSMIQFYHDLAVFFHYSQVPSLQDYIFADPQWLIEQFAKILTLEGFEEFHNELLWKDLRESGILVQPLYEGVWKSCEIKPQSLVDLLVHFLLAAPIQSDVKLANHPGKKLANHSGKKYFISIVLPAYSDSIADISEDEPPKYQAAPLHLLFNTYYVPPGFFSRLVTALLNQSNFRVAFSKGVFRDRIVMLYSKAHNEIDEITFTKYTESIQIKVARTQNRPKGHVPFSVACRNLLQIINNCFPQILYWLKGIELNYAFACESCLREKQSDHSQFVSFSLTDTVYTYLHCDHHPHVKLGANHQNWLLFSENNQCTKELEDSQIEQVGRIIQAENKVEELAETLEMNYLLEGSSKCPYSAYELLSEWSHEMQAYTPELRSHLAHHLDTIGMKDVAHKISRNRPLVHASVKLATAEPHSLTIAQSQRQHQHALDMMVESEGVGPGTLKHLGKIAEFMYEWEGRVSDELGLTQADVAQIKRKHTFEFKLQVREALQIWQRKHGRDATYKELADAFKKAGYKDYADYVHQIEIEQQTSKWSHQDHETLSRESQLIPDISVVEPAQSSAYSTEGDKLATFESVDSKSQELDTQAQQLPVSPITSQAHPPFSKELSIQELSLWLKNHPEVGSDYQDDIDKLKEAKVNGRVFSMLNEASISRFKVSLGFELLLLEIIRGLVQHH